MTAGKMTNVVRGQNNIFVHTSCIC